MLPGPDSLEPSLSVSEEAGCFIRLKCSEKGFRDILSEAVGGAGAELVDGIDQGQDVFYWGFRQDAVAEIEDMTRSAAGLPENLLDPTADQRWTAEQYGRIEVALDAPIIADLLPGRIKANPPIHTDNLAARLAHKR